MQRFRSIKLLSVAVGGAVLIGGLFALQNMNCRVIVRQEDNEKVAYLKEGLLKKKEDITWLTVPEGTTAIGQGAFEGCDSLEKILLPDSIREIRDNAFMQCAGLRSIFLPENITYLGNRVFEGCRNLNYVYVGEYLDHGLKYLGDRAFFNSGVRAVELPYTVEDIGVMAFAECENLRELSMPQKFLEEDKARVILGEHNSEDLKLYMSTREIDSLENYYSGVKYNISEKGGAYAEKLSGDARIANAIKIDRAIYPILWIGACASKENDIEAITLPKYLYGVGEQAFYGCKNLEKVIFSDNIKIIRSEAFFGCAGLEEIKLPYSLNKIGRFAFYGAEDLKVPDHVEIIEDGGLAGVHSVRISSGLNINYMGDIFQDKRKTLRELIVPNSWILSEQFKKFNIDSEHTQVRGY